jgi:hypothetical protein
VSPAAIGWGSQSSTALYAPARLDGVRHDQAVGKWAKKTGRPSRKRRGLAPGPASRTSQPGSVLAWRSRPMIVFWGLLVLIPVAACVFLLVFSLHEEIVLDMHHSNAVARVIQVDEDGRGRGSAQVQFAAGGKLVRAWIAPSLFGGVPQAGDRIQIEYLTSDPGTVRRAGAHDIVMFGVGLGGVGLLAAAVDRFRNRRKQSRHRI